MDRYLISGGLALLLFEVFILLADLGMLPTPLLPEGQHISTTGQVIGNIHVTHQQVRRRSQNSMLWQNSQQGDQVRGFDSVLTLDGSSAQLNLDGNIKIQLHENTLIVVEPLPEKDTGEFRLKFARGDLRSRSKRSFQLSTEDWTLKAQAGSDLSLRSRIDGKLELEVSKGHVAMANKTQPEKSQVFHEGQRVTVNEEAVEQTQSLSEDLKWLPPLESRVYTHADSATVHLTWSGSPSKIRHVFANKLQPNIIVGPQHHEVDMELARGTHHLSLENDTGVSRTLTVHVWLAEKLVYFSPLPRHRADLKLETLFSWSPIKQAESYRIEIAQDSEFKTLVHSQTQNGNHYSLRLTQEGLHFWRVIGIDDEQSAIPPLYNSRLYSVSNPLDAPILREPAQATPSPKNENPPKVKKSPPPQSRQQINRLPVFAHWIWTQILPVANATSSVEATRSVIFRWDTVAGADYYAIEISSTPEFFNPEVVTEVLGNEFLWRGFKPGIYYWRVAGGEKNGRMGLFSQPEKVDLTKPENLHLDDEPSAPTAPPQKSLLPAIATDKPPAAEAMLVSQEAPLQILGFIRWHWPHLVYDYRAPDNVNTKLSGFTSPALTAAVQWPLRDQHFIETRLDYAEFNWKPTTPSDLPFQSNLVSWTFNGDFFYQDKTSSWSWGLTLNHLPLVQRQGLESVHLTDIWTYGVGSRTTIEFEKPLHSEHTLSLNYGHQYWHPRVNNNIYYNLGIWKKTPLYLGLLIDIDFLFGPDSSTAFLGRSSAFLQWNW